MVREYSQHVKKLCISPSLVCAVEIALSKNPLPVDAFPETPTAHPPPSLHSTPSTTTISPGLTPFTTPTASPHSATIAAFLAQANSSLQHSPQINSPTGASVNHVSPGRSVPVQLSSSSAMVTSPSSMTGPNPASSLSSPQALPSKHVLPVTTKPEASHSPVSTAKAVLHHRCPSNQPECVSPLVKSFANTESVSSPVQGSPAASNSPSAKFVTVSILQQLQQNPNISKLLSAAAHQSNGSSTST